MGALPTLRNNDKEEPWSIQDRPIGSVHCYQKLRWRTNGNVTGPEKGIDIVETCTIRRGRFDPSRDCSLA